MAILKRFVVVGRKTDQEYESTLLTVHVKELNQMESLQVGTTIQYFPTLFGFIHEVGERADQRETYSTSVGQKKITVYEKEIGSPQREHYLIFHFRGSNWQYQIGYVIARQCSVLLESRIYSEGIVTYGADTLDRLAEYRGKFY